MAGVSIRMQLVPLWTSLLTKFLLLLVYHWADGSGNGTLLGIQLLAVLFIFGWTFTVMGSYYYFLNFMGWLKIDPLEEEVGMDISRHKGSAYDLSGARSEDVTKLTESRHDNSVRKGKNSGLPVKNDVSDEGSKHGSDEHA